MNPQEGWLIWNHGRIDNHTHGDTEGQEIKSLKQTYR